MVKSTENYKEYKEKLFEQVKANHGENYANKLLDFISDRYDEHSRVFLDKNLMFLLRDDYQRIINGNIVIILCVGLGFVGKTTLGKNICYYMDPTFTNERIAWGFGEFVDRVSDNIERKNKAYLIDEPNDVPSNLSKEGIALKEIFGQLRQQQMFLLLCSTDFKDIPATVIRKVTTLIYLDLQGHGYLIRDRPEYNEYPLHEFKKKYHDEGYAAIQRVIKKYSHLEINTHKANILEEIDPQGERKYDSKKKSELMRSIKKYRAIQKHLSASRSVLNEEARLKRNQRIADMYSKGQRIIDIASELKMSRQAISNIVNSKKSEVNT